MILMRGMGLSLNPFHYINEAVKGVTSVVGSAAATAGRTAQALASNRELMRVGVMAAAAANGIPPQQAAQVFDAFTRTGRIPPGTDPRLAAYLAGQEPTNWPLIIGGGAAGLLVLFLLLGRRD